jgi:hypothetical protein
MAKERFRHKGNVTVLSGTSEERFREAIDQIRGPVAFWLDGHFSGGITFKGASDTPIQFELDVIAEEAQKFERLTVFVDDFRCFAASVSTSEPYPAKAYLVNWAERLGLNWTIEHDIFVARNYAD